MSLVFSSTTLKYRFKNISNHRIDNIFLKTVQNQLHEQSLRLICQNHYLVRYRYKPISLNIDSIHMCRRPGSHCARFVMLFVSARSDASHYDKARRLA